MRRLLTGLACGAALILAAPPLRAEMTDAEREAFRAEVRAYLLENPEILSEMFALLDARQEAAATARDAEAIRVHAEAIFDDGFSWIGGNPDGSVTLVEFLDYQCRYCRAAHPEIQALLAEDGDIRWIVKELPVLGPASEEAARAAVATLIAAGPEAYARVTSAFLQTDGALNTVAIDLSLEEAGLDPASIRAGMQDAEVTRRLAETQTLARALGIEGTPSFVLDDRMLRGYLPGEAMRAVVDDVRNVN